MKDTILTRGMRSFFVIWFGQLISLIGSGLTGFALGVWVYQRTGSVTQFALISVFTMLPGIVISPIAGAIVDRYNRRWIMILSDSGAAASTLAIALLLGTGRLQIWHIYLATGISSTFSAFQWPAYRAAISTIVPKEQLGRASGMTQLGEAAAQLVSPVLAGFLLGIIQLHGIILLDFATFLFSLVTLLLVRFAEVKDRVDSETSIQSLLRDVTYGWNYITTRPGLFALLLFFAADNLIVGMVQILFTPLVLSITTAAVLGTMMSIGGIGMLCGSILISTWGGPKKLIYGVFVFEFLSGLCVVFAGFRTEIPLLTLAAFLFFFGVPIINGCSQAIWQKKVALDVQGRVFAVTRAIAWSSLPLAYLLAGPLADRVFEPLMVRDGLLANSVGQIIGVGEGRGIGLLFILMGCFSILVTITAYQYPRLRQVETEIPDAINTQEVK